MYYESRKNTEIKTELKYSLQLNIILSQKHAYELENTAIKKISTIYFLISLKKSTEIETSNLGSPCNYYPFR